MWLVEQYQLSLGERGNASELAKARARMKDIEETIAWLKTFLKNLSKSSE